MVRSIALDIGSTRIKAGSLGNDGHLLAVVGEAAPALTGAGTIREGDPSELLRIAGRVLERASAGLPGGAADELPLGITSQRSSFLLWEARAGRAVTPFISWQDRRAVPWCEGHADLEPEIARRTGLRLTPHYLGPKLAFLFDGDPGLRARAESGELLAGTLESWLLWNWSAGELHRTDPTMAARTALFDIEAGAWSMELLGLFGVPERVLPEVLPTSGAPSLVPGRGRLTATIADQASGVFAVAEDRDDVALVTFGTGTFVLAPTGSRVRRLPGYLAGTLLAVEGRPERFALEGSINGGGAVAEESAPGPTELPEVDPAPDAFCIPDRAGLGAPHWRPDLGLDLSRAAIALAPASKRRVVLEGLLFRVREVLEDLEAALGPRRVMVSGGLTRDPFIASGLAALLARPVALVDEPEATLLGAARLAAGFRTERREASAVVTPGVAGGYLPGKYARWKQWITERVAAGARGPRDA